jgi:hypothetical protein
LTKAVSESFANELGYTNLSGATLRFGVAKAAKGAETESIVTVNVWNARGFQNGPGAILESKEVPLRTILDDVANNRATKITFDRNVPLSGLGYHIGIELNLRGRRYCSVGNHEKRRIGFRNGLETERPGRLGAVCG